MFFILNTCNVSQASVPLSLFVSDDAHGDEGVAAINDSELVDVRVIIIQNK
jgi:hypothetical protein